MAKTISPDMASKEAARIAMKEIKKNADLLKVFGRIRIKYNEINASDVLGRYEIGREVEKVVNDENKFGSSAVSKMADALLMNDSDMYKWKDMATTWTVDEIKALSVAKTATGKSLTVMHLTTLASLPDAKLRERLMARCYKESLSARDLAVLVTSKVGSRTNNPNGRKVVLRSPSAGTAQMIKLSEKWLNYSEAVEQMVFEPLDKKPADYADEALADSLQSLKNACEEIREAADQGVTKIEAARQKVLAALETQEQEEAQKKSEKKAKDKTKQLKLKGKLKLKNKKLKLGGKKKPKLHLGNGATKPPKLKLKSGGKTAIAKAKKKVAASTGEPASAE